MPEQNIYNTNLVRQNQNFDPSKVLVVDSTSLITLAKAGKLNLLLASNRKIIITETVFEEVASDALVASGIPDSTDIRQWIQNNPATVTVDQSLNYPSPLGASDQGELAIQMYADAYGGSQDVRVLSDDQAFLLGSGGFELR